MTQINRVMKYLYNGVGSPLAGAAEAVRIQARMLQAAVDRRTGESFHYFNSAASAEGRTPRGRIQRKKAAALNRSGLRIGSQLMALFSAFSVSIGGEITNIGASSIRTCREA